ncbi:hypothetical protein H0H81_011739 [Sphagnurus paluster]|uniref:MFS transporter n=1 Tax=Sphagnurus paluster TaxID=117069 RepID=A0A9P7GVF2_9AGAR|nr:hypothetical protein H0H81_011739 [Sphagnurus paluster]
MYGNVGVIKTLNHFTLCSPLIEKLWPFLPLSWFAGVTIGPLIGGYLSRPADRFPSLFGQSAFMKQYPYFLPCAVPAAFSAFFSIVAIYFLKETLRSPAPISQILKVLRNDRVIRIEAQDKPTPLRAVLTSRVIVAVGNYAFVALIEIAFRAIQPLFLATPVTLGGLGLSPPEIGVVLSLSGIVCGIFQVAFFARIHTFLGSKRTFVVGMMAPAPFFLMFPIANMLARIQAHNGLLWLVVGTQAMLPIAFGLSYGTL